MTGVNHFEFFNVTSYSEHLVQSFTVPNFIKFVELSFLGLK